MQVIAGATIVCAPGKFSLLNSSLGGCRRGPLFSKFMRIMKWKTFILLAICLQVGAQGQAQKITLAINDAPLANVFNVIEQQTDLGFVYDAENGMEANEAVKGTNKRATSDIKGEFSLKEVEEKSQLVISDMVYAKIFDGGNVSLVKSKEIEKQPVQDPLFTLQGRVTGLEITQVRGLSVDVVTVRIQALNSLEIGNDRFIKIDGTATPCKLSASYYQLIRFQAGSPFIYFNPKDIETIAILKDAYATAIYGSGACDGVILSTTKKGKIDNNRFDITRQVGWGQVATMMYLLNIRSYYILSNKYFVFDRQGVNPQRLFINDRKFYNKGRIYGTLFLGGAVSKGVTYHTSHFKLPGVI